MPSPAERLARAHEALRKIANVYGNAIIARTIAIEFLEHDASASAQGEDKALALWIADQMPPPHSGPAAGWMRSARAMLRKIAGARAAPTEPEFTASIYGSAAAATQARDKWRAEHAAPTAGEDNRDPDISQGRYANYDNKGNRCD